MFQVTADVVLAEIFLWAQWYLFQLSDKSGLIKLDSVLHESAGMPMALCSGVTAMILRENNAIIRAWHSVPVGAMIPPH
jgi:hypothetical protein